MIETVAQVTEICTEICRSQNDVQENTSERNERKERKKGKKQVACRTPEGAEKQLDYILVNRKFLRCSRDAEANDRIHMGSDHGRVMAQFVISAPKKKDSQNGFKKWRKN